MAGEDAGHKTVRQLLDERDEAIRHRTMREIYNPNPEHERVDVGNLSDVLAAHRLLNFTLRLVEATGRQSENAVEVRKGVEAIRREVESAMSSLEDYCKKEIADWEFEAERQDED